MPPTPPTIISGQYRGRRLKVPNNQRMRPTLGRCKKTLFDIIASRIPPNHRANMTFLDIFGGCGSVGLEALSIGFGTAYFIENHPESLAVLKENCTIDEEGSAHIIRSDAFNPPPPPHPPKSIATADIAFLDPPYDIQPDDWQKLLSAYNKSNWISDETWIIAQHLSLPAPNFSPYQIDDERLFGKTALTFLAPPR